MSKELEKEQKEDKNLFSEFEKRYSISTAAMSTTCLYAGLLFLIAPFLIVMLAPSDYEHTESRELDNIAVVLLIFVGFFGRAVSAFEAFLVKKNS
jgi:hypothetical protein